MFHDENDDENCDSGDDECGADTREHRGPYPGYGSWWPTPSLLGAGGRRGAALQERIFRDHQRQLDDFSKQVASGAYTAQSLVSEVWTFWGRVLGDQADMVRVAYGIKPHARAHEKSPRVYAFTMPAGDGSATFTLRLDSDLLPEQAVALRASALRSRDYNWELQPTSISFKPERIKHGPRAEQVVDITFALGGAAGNQWGSGHYVGTLYADELPLGLLVLEITDLSSKLGR